MCLPCLHDVRSSSQFLIAGLVTFGIPIALALCAICCLLTCAAIACCGVILVLKKLYPNGVFGMKIGKARRPLIIQSGQAIQSGVAQSVQIVGVPQPTIISGVAQNVQMVPQQNIKIVAVPASAYAATGDGV